MSDGRPSRGTFDGYKKDEDVPLFSYGVLAGTFNLLFALFLTARVTGKPLPQRIEARDIVLLGMATWLLSMVGSQDAITSPLGAPLPSFRRRRAPRWSKRNPGAKALEGRWVSY